MTKKTQARVTRDLKAKKEYEEFKEVTSRCWDELGELYTSCLTAMTSSSRIIPILRNQDILANVPDIKALQAIASIVSKDTKEYREAIEKIHANHAGKTGGTDDTGELMQAIQIGEQYQQWLLSFHSVVSPGVQQILNMANDALVVMQAKETPANKEVVAESK